MLFNFPRARDENPGREMKMANNHSTMNGSKALHLHFFPGRVENDSGKLCLPCARGLDARPTAVRTEMLRPRLWEAAKGPLPILRQREHPENEYAGKKLPPLQRNQALRARIAPFRGTIGMYRSGRPSTNTEYKRRYREVPQPTVLYSRRRDRTQQRLEPAKLEPNHR